MNLRYTGLISAFPEQTQHIRVNSAIGPALVFDLITESLGFRTGILRKEVFVLNVMLLLMTQG